jgi:Protein of unknown function (DUF3485)
MFRMIPVAFSVAAVIACGVVHGYWTDRWEPAREPADAAARLNDLPLAIGDWEGQAIDAKLSTVAGVAGMIQRRYVHRATGETVLIALVCGRPGPVSIHTPDVCYGASGYTVGQRTRKSIPGAGADFWCADAVKTQATEESQLRIYWGWSAGTGWKAAEDARQLFPRVPVLHKLYVIREVNGTIAKDGDGEPCQRFLQALLPALDRALYPSGV